MNRSIIASVLAAFLTAGCVTQPPQQTANETEKSGTTPQTNTLPAQSETTICTETVTHTLKDNETVRYIFQNKSLVPVEVYLISTIGNSAWGAIKPGNYTGQYAMAQVTALDQNFKPAGIVISAIQQCAALDETCKASLLLYPGHNIQREHDSRTYDVHGRPGEEGTNFWWDPGAYFGGTQGTYTIDIVQTAPLAPGQSCVASAPTAPHQVGMQDIYSGLSIRLVGQPYRVPINKAEVIRVKPGVQEGREFSISRSREVSFDSGHNFGGNVEANTAVLSALSGGVIPTLKGQIGGQLNKEHGIRVEEGLTETRTLTFSGDVCQAWQVAAFAHMRTGMVKAPALGVNSELPFEFTDRIEWDYNCIEPQFAPQR